MRSPNIQQRLYLARAMNEQLEGIFEHDRQLNELSKKTYGNYIKKASKDAVDRVADASDAWGRKYVSYGHVRDARRKAEKRLKGIERATDAMSEAELGRAREAEETLGEGVTRKHFQQVADVIKAHPDPKKRAELAAHHAEIFKKQNPRFDHARFFKAANAQQQTNEARVRGYVRRVRGAAILGDNRRQDRKAMERLAKKRQAEILAARAAKASDEKGNETK
jgi:hypothetical protein